MLPFLRVAVQLSFETGEQMECFPVGFCFVVCGSAPCAGRSLSAQDSGACTWWGLEHWWEWVSLPCSPRLNCKTSENVLMG